MSLRRAAFASVLPSERTPPARGRERRDRSVEQQLSPIEREMAAAVERKHREDPKLQYHEALKLVSHENRDLARRYREHCFGPGIELFNETKREENLRR